MLRLKPVQIPYLKLAVEPSDHLSVQVHLLQDGASIVNLAVVVKAVLVPDDQAVPRLRMRNVKEVERRAAVVGEHIQVRNEYVERQPAAGSQMTLDAPQAVALLLHVEEGEEASKGYDDQRELPAQGELPHVALRPRKVAQAPGLGGGLLQHPG